MDCQAPKSVFWQRLWKIKNFYKKPNIAYFLCLNYKNPCSLIAFESILFENIDFHLQNAFYSYLNWSLCSKVIANWIFTFFVKNCKNDCVSPGRKLKKHHVPRRKSMVRNFSLNLKELFDQNQWLKWAYQEKIFF